jgi:hypothetical protein
MNRLPPFFIYYAAGHNYRNGRKHRPHQRTDPSRFSRAELAKIADMPERTFARIASKLSWDEVKVRHIEPFCRACGVDILRQDAFYKYIRKTRVSGRPYSHLNDQQLKHFELLTARYLKMLEDQPATCHSLASP